MVVKLVVTKSLKTHTNLATSTLIILLSNMFKFSKKKFSKNKACKGNQRLFGFFFENVLLFNMGCLKLINYSTNMLWKLPLYYNINIIIYLLRKVVCFVCLSHLNLPNPRLPPHFAFDTIRKPLMSSEFIDAFSQCLEFRLQCNNY